VRSFAREPTAVSIASHTTAKGTASPHVSASKSTCTAADNIPACRAWPGARLSVALSDSRAARPTISLVMNTSNSSSASSVAVTSSHRTVANSVAILRSWVNAASFGAFASAPIRANSISRRVGTPVLVTSTAPMCRPAICDTRSNDFTRPRPVEFFGPRRHESNRDRRSPSGTSRISSSEPACSAVTACDNTRYTRRSAALRTLATSSCSVVTPGSSTRSARNRATAE
jgi:hypothetical protein